MKTVRMISGRKTILCASLGFNCRPLLVGTFVSLLALRIYASEWSSNEKSQHSTRAVHLLLRWELWTVAVLNVARWRIDWPRTSRDRDEDYCPLAFSIECHQKLKPIVHASNVIERVNREEYYEVPWHTGDTIPREKSKQKSSERLYERLRMEWMEKTEWGGTESKETCTSGRHLNILRRFRLLPGDELVQHGRPRLLEVRK